MASISWCWTNTLRSRARPGRKCCGRRWPTGRGRALFIGTPQGFNHFHELVESAEALPDWKTFQFTTAEGCNVSPEELVSAAQDLDERTFRQEFLASFETLGVGRAYYAFDRATECQ